MSAERASHRRGDLQGLRAVAVLAVIAYHFSIPGAPGGFVGVDIFFVLSGFFIIRLLMRDIEEHGGIRLARFWANRAKRLLPNGLLTILAVLIAAVFLLPSYRLPGISEDALSAAAFFANFHFADRMIDYFHLDDPPSPLLHFWSLAVEEQFYLVLPLLITAAVPLYRRSSRTAVLALLGLSDAIDPSTCLSHSPRTEPKRSENGKSPEAGPRTFARCEHPRGSSFRFRPITELPSPTPNIPEPRQKRPTPTSCSRDCERAMRGRTIAFNFRNDTGALIA